VVNSSSKTHKSANQIFMAYRRRYKRTSYKRRYKRRGYSRKGTSSRYRYQSGFRAKYAPTRLGQVSNTNWLPNSREVKLNAMFVGTIDPNTTLGGTKDVVISLNNLLTPYVSGGGSFSSHRPMGYDQIKNMFYHGTVTRCRITFRVGNTNDNAGYEALFGVEISGSSATLDGAQPATLCERSNGVWKQCSNADVFQNNREVSVEVDIPKFFKRTKKAFIASADFQFATQTSTAPTEAAYAHCWIGPLDTSVDMGGFACSIFVEYVCTFTEPIQQASS